MKVSRLVLVDGIVDDGDRVYLAKVTRKGYGMDMQKVAFNQLSESVREFLAQVRKGQGLVIEDETGRAQYGVIPYVEATPGEQQRAWKKIQEVQQKVGQNLADQGVTEDDLIKAALADD